MLNWDPKVIEFHEKILHLRLIQDPTAIRNSGVPTLLGQLNSSLVELKRKCPEVFFGTDEVFSQKRTKIRAQVH